MAEVVYLVPDVFNPGKLVVSATPPLDGDPFNPPRPHNLLLASAGMWKAGRRPTQEDDDDGGGEWIEVIFDRPEPRRRRRLPARNVIQFPRGSSSNED